MQTIRGELTELDQDLRTGHISVEPARPGRLMCRFPDSLDGMMLAAFGVKATEFFGEMDGSILVISDVREQ